jgi:hypothetical protein
MKKEIFAECIGFLQAQFGKADDDRVKGLYMALKNLTDEQMRDATKRILKGFAPTSACPFPVPSHFITASGSGPKTKAQNLMAMLSAAVHKVGAYRSVDFGSPTLHAVIKRFGGWPAICRWGQDEWNINEGRFLAALENAVDYDENGGDHLAGIYELQNGNVTELMRLGYDEQNRIIAVPGKPAIEDKTPSREVTEAIAQLTEKMGMPA